MNDAANGEACSILVVDDDASARLVMRAALRKAGFAVHLAPGGAEALQLFGQLKIDLVMLDVDMPGMGGYEVCDRLRELAGPLLPIVMVTGMDDVASVEQAYRHGATDFIAKPVNWALLGYRVRYLLRSHQAMLDLSTAQARNAAVLNAIPDLLFEIEEDGRITEYRAPGAALLPASRAQLIGRNMNDMLAPAAALVTRQAMREAFEAGVANGAQLELTLRKGQAWFELSVARKAATAGAQRSCIVLARDITERKQAEAHITRLAYFDSLTGLANRQSFLDRVGLAVERAARQQGRLAVLFMDLDGFKGVNDTMGHAMGDLVLQRAAERLRESLRPRDLIARPGPTPGDEATASDPDAQLARLGGDEFTALLPDIRCAEDALAVARRIGSLMREPFRFEGRDITLSTSVGIALYPDDGEDAATLLRHADTAMYHAKRSGRDHALVYSPALTEQILQRMELKSSLRLALERGEFHLVYQPQLDVRSGRMRSVEALIRWTHPTRGPISPVDFIPLAEETGLIASIGHWVLRTACTDASRWQAEGRPVGVAVNLSPLQFGSNELLAQVAGALSASGLPSTCLELEVTEGALMDGSLATQALLQSLFDQGVGIALDDFGTGYSSMAYLTRMPISHLKIDRCFISDLLIGGQSQAIVRAVLAMARSLRMKVTAEGVETAAQAQMLKAMECDLLQGFHFSRPVPAADVPALLSGHWPLDLPATSADKAMAGEPTWAPVPAATAALTPALTPALTAAAAQSEPQTRAQMA